MGFVVGAAAAAAVFLLLETQVCVSLASCRMVASCGCGCSYGLRVLVDPLSVKRGSECWHTWKAVVDRSCDGGYCLALAKRSRFQSNCWAEVALLKELHLLYPPELHQLDLRLLRQVVGEEAIFDRAAALVGMATTMRLKLQRIVAVLAHFDDN